MKDRRKEFWLFLEERGAVTNYRNNFEKGWSLQQGVTPEEFLEKVKSSPSIYLNAPFLWTKSVEGMIYWERLNMEWFKYLDELKIKEDGNKV